MSEQPTDHPAGHHADHPAQRKLSWGVWFLIVFLVFLFAIRMYIATSTPYLTYDSYLEVRSVENIQSTGFPLRVDPLRADGELRLLHPVFSYFLAGAVFITPLMYKILPNLFMVLALIPVFLIARKLTESETAALIAVVLAGTGPVFFASYIATPSAVPLAFLLILTIVYLFVNPEKNLFLLILCTILLTFIHPLIFILVCSLLIIMLLLRLEGFGIDSRVNELFFFTLLLSVWFYVVVYKNVLFRLGTTLIWQTTPGVYTTNIIASVSSLAFLYGLGVITFLFGAIGIYHALFVGKEKTMYIAIAPIFATLLLFFTNLLTLNLGILLLTPFFAILAGYGIMISFDFFTRTKFPWLQYAVGVLLFVVFILGAILPALASANQELGRIPSESQVRSYVRVGEVLPQSAIIVTTVKEAFAVQYFAHKKTVADAELLLSKNSQETVNTIDAIYTARFAYSTIEKTQKLGASYILFSRAAEQEYARQKLLIDTPECLRTIDIGEGTLYNAGACASSTSAGAP